jgi:hypothetical protein
METCNNILSRKKAFINSDVLNSGALEAHFVHFKSEYGNASVAITQPDGLAVFGVLFVVSKYKICVFKLILTKFQCALRFLRHN